MYVAESARRVVVSRKRDDAKKERERERKKEKKTIDVKSREKEKVAFRSLFSSI